MKIKLNDWKVSLLKYGYNWADEDLPKSSLAFLSQFIFIIILLPINFPFLLFNKFKKLYLPHYVSMIACFLANLFFAILFSQDNKNHTTVDHLISGLFSTYVFYFILFFIYILCILNIFEYLSNFCDSITNWTSNKFKNILKIDYQLVDDKIKTRNKKLKQILKYKKYWKTII